MHKMFPQSPHECDVNRLSSEVHVLPPSPITCTARTLSPFLTFTNDLAEQTASWKHKEKHQMAARRKTDEAPKSIRRRSCIRGHNPHPFFSSMVRRTKSPVDNFLLAYIGDILTYNSSLPLSSKACIKCSLKVPMNLASTV